ncbi:hypothetical protein [Shewanella sp. GutDb-MelDb]|uniref:hypothetical protein n=1 Tax=Shewanella sp. GutDb-MelDb TaxID=2058316 RepID=UPI000C7E7627|nr:hypothetical protein [Shewanella sp. GutDb-MelDb]PKG59208.1 hypothetical protein CXF82_00435 [Shewanella sp. GutDb-MelDb]
MNFPKIDYEFWLSNWSDSIGDKATYSNKNILKYIVFEGDINSCTDEIYNLVKENDLNKLSVLRVVDLIYSWGGPSGRMFYASIQGKSIPRESLENDDSVFSKYLEGIRLAKQGSTESIKIFGEIDGIGPSYASKHACFWSCRSESPLIIVDSKIAGSLGYKTIANLKRIVSDRAIVTAFKNKAIEEYNESSPIKVERALFAFHNHYFLNGNNGWKNKIQSKDFAEAQNIASVLFE